MAKISRLNRDMVCLILQFLKEEKFENTLHRLEMESGIFFNMKYFEEKFLAGEFEVVDNYLAAFTNPNQNTNSSKIFLEIRKQKYLEALDKQQRAKAIDILMQELKVFSVLNEDSFKDLTVLITLNNFREQKEFSKYGDVETARGTVLEEIKKLIETNPLLHNKLVFPDLTESWHKHIIKESVLRQHQKCVDPLLTDHICTPSDNHLAPSSSADIPVIDLITEAHDSIPPTAAEANPGAVSQYRGNPEANHGTIDAQNPVESPAEVAQAPIQQGSLPAEVLPPKVADPAPIQQPSFPAEVVPTEVTNQAPVQPGSQLGVILPIKVARKLHQGSCITSMDFHPTLHTFLFVGCDNGVISLWEVSVGQKLAWETYKIWNVSVFTAVFQDIISRALSVPVLQVAWSPDGNFVGVAFAKDLIHVYAFRGYSLSRHLEKFAHSGPVNDLAFTYFKGQLSVVTCGADRLIKVWDLHGCNLFNFRGHKSSIFSICPSTSSRVQTMFSSGEDGQIIRWSYQQRNRLSTDKTPAGSCLALRTCADGSRLFLCGQDNCGRSFLLEWDVINRRIKKTYQGLTNTTKGIIPFDTTQNLFIAVGQGGQIKFWEMRNPSLLFSTCAGGGLPDAPRLKYNRKGNLLAVSTADNGFKILASDEGLRYLSNGTVQREFAKIMNSVLYRIVALIDPTETSSKIVRLLYTHAGDGILTLGSNGILKLWKWPRSQYNPSGKASPSIIPQIIEAESDLIMRNDVLHANVEESVPCIALTPTDSSVFSSMGGHNISFDLQNFQAIMYLMFKSPSTFIMIHPLDINLIVIGAEDASINIFNIELNKIQSTMEGHKKRITGLAFSTLLRILVSSDADAQMCIWNIETWEQLKSVSMEMGTEEVRAGETRVAFHTNQIFMLVTHRTQLSIYNAKTMERINRWVPEDCGIQKAITWATYSCNSEFIYATFSDGDIGVFTAYDLQIIRFISVSDYLPQSTIISSRPRVQALVIAGHPQEPDQFAIGLSDGSVRVMEPHESQ